MKNFALYITISSILALVAGCTSWTTPAGDVETTPFTVRGDSNTALARCIDRRSAQRSRLLRDIGIRTEATPTEVQVSYRDSVQLICTQSDRRETAGESRTISREECERLLAPDGIPADANGTVRTEVPEPTADPRLQALMAANPGLFTDDDTVCNGRVIGGGGMNGMTGIAQVGGGFGGMGIMPGAFGLGNATRNIVFVTQGMDPRVTATVSIAGLASNMQLTHLNGETPVTVADGLNYQVNVVCSVNGVPTGSHAHSAEFAKRHPTGTRVMVNALCGRDRG